MENEKMIVVECLNSPNDNWFKENGFYEVYKNGLGQFIIKDECDVNCLIDNPTSGKIVKLRYDGENSFEFKLSDDNWVINEFTGKIELATLI